MNQAVASMYALTINHPNHGPYSDKEKDAIIGRIQPLCEEIARLEAIIHGDPFIAGYLEAKRRGTFAPNPEAEVK